MSVQLLDNIRKISSHLQNNVNNKVSFNDICLLLAETVKSSVIVISRKGKVLGKCSKFDEKIKPSLLQVEVGAYLDETFNERLIGVLSTNDNANLSLMGLPSNEASKLKAMIIPVYISGNRQGTIIVYRNKPIFGINDIITAEYAATVVGLELTYSIAEEDGEEQRKLKDVADCIKTLTELEIVALEAVLSSVSNVNEYVVTKNIADNLGITRSVLINALKKAESAGVIEVRSAGSKGTRITIKNEYLIKSLKKK